MPMPTSEGAREPELLRFSHSKKKEKIEGAIESDFLASQFFILGSQEPDAVEVT
jgi:hypothetical protein